MKELNEGYVPKELREKYNKKIGVALEDKRDKKYRPPTPPAYVAYSGAGMSVADVQGTGGAVNKDATRLICKATELFISMLADKTHSAIASEQRIVKSQNLGQSQSAGEQGDKRGE